ncbi:hypothetical protein [Flagellimonas meishanensis]|uniref:hypothetical protein n=1 Tax=Flagellimonas meishanensis TaxID=2873264 RepID=UPI001CA685C4|nr:hypothetical protein [[Muricauda] meishanensis]
MNQIEKSIFNLITIFRMSPKAATSTLITPNHCEQKFHHDFYCDAEKPFVAK